MSMTAGGKHRQREATRSSLLIGLGSLADIRGTATYERMRAQMPEPIRRTPRESMEQVARSLEPKRSPKG
jgi:hypothetical protein